ncbi:hypothetical protein [Microcystis sp. LSC13-02]|jgi:hypothetical protein|uniref:hypothetical protein n=1 Tax=Microcystis sp. LSC13-02 TaxID=1895004 RepID=UPI00257E5C7C|nr:hypothetical protein [Microcystis sp. LSC13-02]
MSNTETTAYLDRLLKLYEEKLNRFRLSLALLLVGTLVFFFLIFFPYITLLGNQEACRENPQCTKPEKSKLEDRLSEITTSWGKVPISTAEVTALFPVGVACGFVVVTAQLQGLIRLRRAITQQLKASSNYIDVTLIAPLLIDPKSGWVDRIAGVTILLFPFCVFIYSSVKISTRLEVLKNKLPYIQSARFYYLIYFLSAFTAIYTLVRLSFLFPGRNKNAR